MISGLYGFQESPELLFFRATLLRGERARASYKVKKRSSPTEAKTWCSQGLKATLGTVSLFHSHTARGAALLAFHSCTFSPPVAKSSSSPKDVVRPERLVRDMKLAEGVAS